jgi:hypothetical protein
MVRERTEARLVADLSKPQFGRWSVLPADAGHAHRAAGLAGMTIEFILARNHWLDVRHCDLLIN